MFLLARILDCNEMGCKILVLENSYNKRVPPVGTTGREVKALKPVMVNVSMFLYKVVAILLFFYFYCLIGNRLNPEQQCQQTLISRACTWSANIFAYFLLTLVGICLKVTHIRSSRHNMISAGESF